MSRSKIIFPHVADVLLRIPPTLDPTWSATPFERKDYARLCWSLGLAADTQLRVLGCVLIDPSAPPALAGYRGPVPKDYSIFFIGPHFVFADKREVTVETIQAHPGDTDRTHVIPVEPAVAIEFALMHEYDPSTWHASREAQPFGFKHTLKPGEAALLLPASGSVGVRLTFGPRAE